MRIMFMESISRSEILQEIDHWIYYENLEGKEVFRELEKYGNRHAVFEKNADFGIVHPDQYNATSFPTGTVNHVAKWTNENTGINEIAINIATSNLIEYPPLLQTLRSMQFLHYLASQKMH